MTSLYRKLVICRSDDDDLAEMFRVYSPGHGPEIARRLREAGYAATDFVAHGRDGKITVVNSVVSRKDTLTVQAIIERVDSQAFITVDEERSLRHGYLRQ